MPRSASRRPVAALLVLMVALLGSCGAGRTATTKRTATTARRTTTTAPPRRRAVTTRRAALTTRPAGAGTATTAGPATTAGAATSPTRVPAVTTTAGPVTPSVPASSRPPRVRLPGFDELAFRLVQAGMAAEQAKTWCALLAANEAQRAQGLKGRRDLSGYDGMLFSFPEEMNVSFYMRTVPVGLSIAWFSSSGRLVGTADMAACGDREDCPLYGPNAPFRYALEVLEGGLPALGVGPNARLELLGACPA